LRAAVTANLRLMIPLVTRLDEVERTRELMVEEAERLERSGIPAAKTVPLGVMVETPAAAVLADRFVQISDFLSVGTNDLTQYTLVVDRGNARLADRFTPHDPSVLRLLKLVSEAAKAAGEAGERLRRNGLGAHLRVPAARPGVRNAVRCTSGAADHQVAHPPGEHRAGTRRGRGGARRALGGARARHPALRARRSGRLDAAGSRCTVARRTALR
jgi:hypothetical protein